MSSESLSQSEIDLLFSGGTPAQPAAPSAERPPDVQVYDFRRPNLISKDRLRALEAMYGLLVKSLEGWLTPRVRGGLEMQLLGVEQFSFGEFVLSLPNPSSSFVFDIADSGGQQAVVDFGHDFAFFLVDRLLGAAGSPMVQARALSPLERMVVRIVADRVAEQLGEIWQDHVRLKLALSRFEAVPDMLQIANREDPMLVANVLVRAAGAESSLLLCLPFTILEKFFTGSSGRRHNASRTTGKERLQEHQAMERAIRKATASVAARLPSFTVKIEELAELKVKDLLHTGLRSDAEIVIEVEGRPQFTARPGSAGRQLGVQITGIVPVGQEAAAAPNQGRRENVATANESSGEQEAAGMSYEALESANGNGVAGLSSLLGLSLAVTVELGATRMSIQEILELGRGSVIQLDRLVGEPVDVIVGDRRFAEGEVVVLGEQFGVRITRLVSSAVPAAAS